MWSSGPSGWVLAGSMTDIAITSLLALSGTLMDPLAWHILATVLAAATAFAAILDQIKRLVLSAVRIE
jgi:hypothetical protein